MGTDFTGLAPEAFAWFAGLEHDNTKAYFTATREIYENAVRGALEAMLAELTREFGGEVRMFRQNRDVRFSNDKSPYKTNTYGVLRDGEAPGEGLYVSISATGLYAGSGYHMLARDQLGRLRDAIVDDATGPGLEAAVASAQDAGLEVGGESLSTAPRGYPKDHPRIELLRRKALVAGRRLPGGEAGIARDAALQHAASTWRAAIPMTAWLEQHVGPSTIPMDQMRRRR